LSLVVVDIGCKHAQYVHNNRCSQPARGQVIVVRTELLMHSSSRTCRIPSQHVF
jgi:hypothetical protein